MKEEIDTFHIKSKPTYNGGMYSQMENIKHKSEDVTEESAPKKMPCQSGAKEYHTFINTMVSVVEKYGAEILEEIDCAV